MKIGEVARLSNLSVATLRYYVNSGLIVPKLKNTKFDFTADDLKDVQIIASLKKMGFSINEMHRIISLKRVSNWVETEDLLDYIRIMVKKREELKDRIVETQNQITMLDHEIETTNRQIVVVRKPTGVPTRAIEHLCCPHCRLPLQLNEARMNYQYIFSGKLECECGYTAEIKNGVIITNGPEISRYDKPDINRTIYKEMPGDLVTYFQKAYNWLLPKLPSANSDGNVIMETHLNSFFFSTNTLKRSVQRTYILSRTSFQR